MVRMCKSTKCLNGKTVIITGANTGIGYETALDLAKRGARIILACRNEERANAAKDKLTAATDNQNIVVKLIDLASFKSVREFAKDIIRNEQRLDLLINNAGAMNLEDKLTEDGLLLEMQSNYFSHVLLTMLLLDLLKKSAPSRIINVSSSAASLVRNLNLDELNKDTGSVSTYNKTKLCQVFFTQQLAKHLEGTNVTTYSLHPGVVASEFLRFSGVWSLVMRPFSINVEQGAQTSIHCALAEDIEQFSGEHFEDSQKIAPYCSARDEDKAKKLWDISMKTIGWNI